MCILPYFIWFIFSSWSNFSFEWCIFYLSLSNRYIEWMYLLLYVNNLFSSWVVCPLQLPIMYMLRQWPRFEWSYLSDCLVSNVTGLRCLQCLNDQMICRIIISVNHTTWKIKYFVMFTKLGINFSKETVSFPLANITYIILYFNNFDHGSIIDIWSL